MVILDTFLETRGNLAGDVFKIIKSNSDRAQAKLIETFTNIILRENGTRFKTNQRLHDMDSIEFRFSNFMENISTTDMLNAARREELEDNRQRFNNREAVNKSSPFKNYKSDKSNLSPAQQKLMSEICKQYNSGSCTRMNTYDKNTNRCQLNPSTKLQNICSAKKHDNSNSLCLQRHPAVNHPQQQAKQGGNKDK